jgi:thymidylate synthase (FAD)
MDCWRQWIRHRTANVNEYSTRYSIAIDSSQSTPADEWRSQAASNRQGSGDPLPVDIGENLSRAERELQEHSKRVYEERLAAGVAREQARKDLPLSTYTEAYWKVDLHNLLHFLSLRMDAHAQQEIRDYATTIGQQIVKPLFPIVWEAYEDYRMGGMFLSRLDRGVIQRLMQAAESNGTKLPLPEEAFLAAQDPDWKELTRSRERDECREKLQQLGILAKTE